MTGGEQKVPLENTFWSWGQYQAVPVCWVRVEEVSSVVLWHVVETLFGLPRYCIPYPFPHPLDGDSQDKAAATISKRFH